MARRYQSLSVSPETAVALPAASLSRLVDFYLAECELRQHSAQTIEGRTGRLQRFVRWVEETAEVPSVGEEEVRAFLAYLINAHKEKGGRWNDAARHPSASRAMGAGTYKTYFSTLRAFLNWCVEQGELTVSPLAGVPRPATPQDQVQPFTEEQLQALEAASKRTQNPERDHAIFCLLLDTGIREMELCDLTIGDFDSLSLQVTVRRGKGGKFRQIPIGPKTRRAINIYLKLRLRAGEKDPTEPLFVTEMGAREGECLRRLALFRIVYRWGEAAGIQRARCSPHTFRNSFAIRFLQNGGHVFSLQRMLGHTSLSVTQRYVALAEGDVARQHALYSPLESLGRKGGRR